MTLAGSLAIRRSAPSTVLSIAVLCGLLSSPTSLSANEPAADIAAGASAPLGSSVYPQRPVVIPSVATISRVSRTPALRVSAAAAATANVPLDLSLLYTEEAFASGAAQAPGAERAREIMRSAVDTLGICIGRSLKDCRDRVAAVFSDMEAAQLTARMWADFRSVRNNMYFYVVAPSFLLAKKILTTRGGCDEWRQLGPGLPTLADLLNAADLELGSRADAAERKELTSLKDRRLRLCPAT